MARYFTKTQTKRKFMTNKKPVVLVILDGFGYSNAKKYNAIAHAHRPHLDNWFTHYPHTLLQASGMSVGLPSGYIGNSEVGHLTIGSGRIVEQPITVLNKAISDGSFFKNKILQHELDIIAQNKGTLHIIGLLSDAGVHSLENHLFAFLDTAVNHGIHKIIVHPFLDGRDTPPQSAATYLKKLDKKLQELGRGTIGSIHGRFFAMDRDRNWDRTEHVYKALTQKADKQKPFATWQNALDHYYHQSITDEFIPPTQLAANSIIKPGDGIIFFNFRPDRARQLTAAFIQKDFGNFKRDYIPLSTFITPVAYADNLRTNFMFPHPTIQHTLKEILAKHGKSIFSIAETEKYAHVTYFFNGMQENPVATETRIIIPSLHAKNYAKYPCMSAAEITKTVIDSLHKNPQDFYLINYANADMVGHTGNFDATVRAVECLDHELEKLYTVIIKELDGTLIITADHGNAEEMYDEKYQQPRTAHTTNPVPFLVINKHIKKGELSLTQLADIAPFILKLMQLPIPTEMIR